MPEPRAVAAGPVPIWPDTLPDPQADGFTVESPPRVEASEVLFGATRLAVKARTAPMSWTFTAWLTIEQMQTWEAFYRDCIENHNGEFYARWIGGARVIAFREPYEYAPIGAGWALTGTVICTRIDSSACDEFISQTFGAIYRDELGAADTYQADLTAADIYADDFDLAAIAANEC